jgi:hypothetical protein
MSYLKAINMPISIILVGFIVYAFFLPDTMPGSAVAVVTGAFTLPGIFYAGWRVYRVYKNSFMLAAYTGAFLFFIDFVILKGGYRLSHPPADILTSPQDWNYLLLGILISYFALLPVAMVLAAVGAWCARKSTNENQGQ